MNNIISIEAHELGGFTYYTVERTDEQTYGPEVSYP